LKFCSIREKLKEVAEKFESREKIFGDEYQNRGKFATKE